MSCSLTVLNFFTVSDYAPFAAVSGSKAVSAVRRMEDRRVLAQVHSRIQVNDYDLLDAPLRLEIPASEVCFQDVSATSKLSSVREVEIAIEASARDLFVSPLALGNHIDHWAVYTAAKNSIPAHKLAFYADLPYASWTGPGVLLERVRATEAATGTPLAAHKIPAVRSAYQKRAAIRQYSSQITASEAGAIALWGERIWIPRGSQAWRALLNDLPKTLGKGPLTVDPHASRRETGLVG